MDYIGALSNEAAIFLNIYSCAFWKCSDTNICTYIFSNILIHMRMDSLNKIYTCINQKQNLRERTVIAWEERV